MLEPGGRGKPLMFATVALAATSAPPMTTSAEFVAGAKSWIPLLRIGSSLFVVSWSSEVAVVPTAKVLKLDVGNAGLPASVTSKATSVSSTLAPLTSLGVSPNSLTRAVGAILLG